MDLHVYVSVAGVVCGQGDKLFWNLPYRMDFGMCMETVQAGLIARGSL